MVDEELHRNEELGPDPGIASRTLTKVQLTDLALGVRELSKRFGRFFCRKREVLGDAN